MVYEQSLQAKRLLSREEYKKTLLVRSRPESKSKSSTSPISMIQGNELAQLVKMVKKVQTRLDGREKKMELMTTTLQTPYHECPKGKG